MNSKEVETKILFVNPCLPTIPKEVVSTPFGVAWMSAVLKENNFQVRALDMQVEPAFRTLHEYLDWNPDIIGVTHFSNFSMGWSGKVVREIREKFPDKPIIAGGVGATYETQRTLNHGVSVVIIGEGEKTVLELANRAKENGGALDKNDYHATKGLAFIDDDRLIYTQPREAIWDLDSLPLPDRSVFDISRYPQGAMITSRGCSHACAFCSSAHFWEGVTGKGNPRVRLRSASNIMAEVNELTDRWNIKQFYILDDVFTVEKERVMTITQSIRDQHLDIKWACLARADQVDLEMMQAMKEAGCTQIHFGLESANDKTLLKIGKAITSETIARGLTQAREAGLRTRTSVILGMPGDTETEVKETITFIENHRPNEVQFYALMPYPGSRWGDNPENYGIRITQLDANLRIQSVYEPFSETVSLTAERMKELATEGIDKLTAIGYTHLTGKEDRQKAGHEFVVSSAFTPIQQLEQYANASSYADIFAHGPLPYVEE